MLYLVFHITLGLALLMRQCVLEMSVKFFNPPVGYR